MAKSILKKPTTSNKTKDAVKKAENTKKDIIGNKKTKSATVKKSVIKKEELTKKVSSKNQLSAKKNKVTEGSKDKRQKKVIVAPNSKLALKKTIKLTKANIPKKPIEVKPVEINYDEVTFQVAAPEVSLLKLEDGSYCVKLTTGVNIKKTSAIHYEFRGKQADGTPFGTIFDCTDETESDDFMNELINFSKSGELIILDENQTETNMSENTEQVENNTPEIKQNDLSEYNGVPLKAEDMNVIINTMKINENNNQNNSIVNPHNTFVPQQPQQTQQNTPLVNEAVNNIITSNPAATNIQPSISNTQIPDHNSNPTIPSQNPQLYPDANYQNPSTNNQSIVTTMTDEQALNQMRIYTKSIEDTLNETFQVRIQGGLTHDDFKIMLNSCSQAYNYEIKHDGIGFCLIVTQGKYSVRVPENTTEYLKVY